MLCRHKALLLSMWPGVLFLVQYWPDYGLLLELHALTLATCSYTLLPQPILCQDYCLFFFFCRWFMFWLLQGMLLQHTVWYHLCSQCDRRGAGRVPLLLGLRCCSAEHLNHLPEPVSDKPPRWLGICLMVCAGKKMEYDSCVDTGYQECIMIQLEVILIRTS